MPSAYPPLFDKVYSYDFETILCNGLVHYCMDFNESMTSIEIRSKHAAFSWMYQIFQKLQVQGYVDVTNITG